MKKITIHQENCEPLVVYDNDSEEKTIYATRLSNLLDSNSISIIEFSESNVIVRPSKISSITVEEVVVSSKTEKVKKEKHEPKDLITDKEN